MNLTSSKFRLGAVSYLNTAPLVWGMLHGRQREEVELSFSIPSVCAEQTEHGRVDAGLVPSVEIVRQGLETIPGVGIACRGAVRSILLFSRVPWRQIRTLAADLSSRTSVQLARVILRERFGVNPPIIQREPDLEQMLLEADAALIIGDPALRIGLDHCSFAWLDLGAEWLALTGMPFLFAAWAGPAGIPVARLEAITRASYEFGKAHLNKIAGQEHQARGISKELAERYITSHIRYELGTKEQEGFETFLQLANLSKGVAYAFGSVSR